MATFGGKLVIITFSLSRAGRTPTVFHFCFIQYFGYTDLIAMVPLLWIAVSCCLKQTQNIRYWLSHSPTTHTHCLRSGYMWGRLLLHCNLTLFSCWTVATDSYAAISHACVRLGERREMSSQGISLSSIPWRHLLPVKAPRSAGKMHWE